MQVLNPVYFLGPVLGTLKDIRCFICMIAIESGFENFTSRLCAVSIGNTLSNAERCTDGIFNLSQLAMLVYI